MKKVLFLFLIMALHCKAQETQKDLKALVLVIASDDLPVYSELVKIWSCYMHLDPAHIEAYFIRGDPDLSEDFKIQDDIIWSKTIEGIAPGIINKTLLSLECMLSRMHDFDYILRTNLSSFYVFPRFLKFLEKLPKQGCYCGVTFPYVSGAGFILTPDVAQLLVQNKGRLLDQAYENDDVVIGQFLFGQGVQAIPAPRMDFLSLAAWNHHKGWISEGEFHFRVKNLNAALRLSDDVYIQKELLSQFYGPGFSCSN